MSGDVERVFGDLQQVLTDLEKLLASSTGEARSHAEQAVSNWRTALKDAQQRLEKLQENTRQRIGETARSASHALRDNPWKSLAIIAGTGFLLGLAIGNHDQSRR